MTQKFSRVVYTDQATAGNGEKKDDFKNKAYLNNEISTLIFEYLAKNGIPTLSSRRFQTQKN